MRWLLVFFAFLLAEASFSQELNVLSLPQADSLQQATNKPIVVFIHTSWCKYCAAMENSTFQSPQLAGLLNEKYLFTKLDAESKKNVTFKGHTFQFRPTGNKTGVHTLAEQLGTVKGKLTYPTISVLNASNEIIFQYQGFLNAEQLMNVLANPVAK